MILTHNLHTFVVELWRYTEEFTHTNPAKIPQKEDIKTYKEV